MCLQMSQVLDAFGRPLRDLRISVTDRCNFRCTYCMPKEVFGHEYRFLDRRELLDFDEITRVARIAVSLGVRKLRLTGGEPLLRRDIERLVAMLATLDAEITLTTNASLLPRKARALADAGLDRITVSLDALDDGVFRAMNDVGFPVERVLAGIDAARGVGLPVKVNCVVKRGVNEGEILPMARYFRETGDTLRFIEFMDVGETNRWRLDEVVTAAEIVATVNAALPIEPADARYRGEVAKRWRYRDGKGELFTCLFAVRGHDLRALLRGGAGDAELADRLAAIWGVRGDRYSELRSQATGLDDAPRVEMSYIGG